MDFMELCSKRYSARSLKGKPSREQLYKIMEAADTAPTAVNKQPVKLFLITGEEGKEKVSTVARTFGAETFFVVGYLSDEAWVRGYDGRNFADVDASIVATHMMLEITELGLATTWIGSFDAPKMKELFPQMRPYELIALFPVGYEADDCMPSPRHRERKKIEDLVTEL